MTRAMRFTIQEATESIPKTREQPSVTDVIFMVGLNDSRRGLDPKEIQERYLDMQLKYAECFPKARQHITSLPPLDDRCLETNMQLQKLSKYTGANFISTKTFLDRNTGKLRANLMVGIHYNEWGTRMLAKEIKKSLYSTANLNDNRLSQFLENDRVDARPVAVERPMENDFRDMHGA